MKKKPNWKLMSAKDKAKYHKKHGMKTYTRGRPRSKKSYFGETDREVRERLKASAIPRPNLTQAQRKELKEKGINYWSSGMVERSRVVL